MKQNNILTSFFLAGSLLLCIFSHGCHLGNTDYSIYGTWIYINETAYDIEVRDINLLDNFSVKPDSSHSIILEYPSSELPKKVNPEELIPPRYSDGCLIIINQKKVYKLKREEGIKSAAIFFRKKMNDYTYTFTYIFTTKQVEEWISESEVIE